MSKRPIDKLSGFCVITGGSSGIGLELARLAAADGCNLLIAADQGIDKADHALRGCGAASLECIEVDLATSQGVSTLMETIGARDVDILMANAGQSEGGAFLDHDWAQIAKTIDTNVTGTLALVHAIGRRMQRRNAGRMLVTGSIVGGMPGPYNLVYNSTKSFINDFCVGLADELKDTDVVISCLKPGATETKFFDRADMEDAPIGDAPKDDPAQVAKNGYDALLKGEIATVSGLLNTIMDASAGVLPKEFVAKLHHFLAKP